MLDRQESHMQQNLSDTVVVTLDGEYDIARQGELDEALAPAYGASVAILDLRAVSYMDSTALTCLLRLKKRMAESGPGVVRLVAPQRPIVRLLDITRLDTVFDVYDSLDAARRDLKA
ncbi:MAG: STAS domain-containing protein [Vulcanimicrobiaceae bacterium]